MTTEITKNLYCVQMRSGVEIWIEEEKTKSLSNILFSLNESKFIEFEDEIINTADISGIYKAKTMQDFTRRKNGQWKCDQSKWHDRNTRCECPKQLPHDWREQYRVKYGIEPHVVIA